MTTLLSINPKSRSGESCDREPLVERLHRLGPVVIHESGTEGLDRAVAALEGRLERIVVGGGDGTLNRSLPTLLEAGVPLGVLPLGTGNDFARALALPLDPEEAVDVILAGQTRKVGLGLANGRWFLNAAGIGLGPELTRKLDGEKKRRLGVLAYLTSAIQVAGNLRTRRALIEVNGFKKRVAFLHITIANGAHYGGGMTVTPEVELDDGRLHVLLLRPQTPLELLRKAFTLRWGADPEEPAPKMELFSSDRVRIHSRKRHEVTIDGELSEHTPLECRCVPGALEVYAPADG